MNQQAKVLKELSQAWERQGHGLKHCSCACGQTCFEHVGVHGQPNLASLDAGQNEGLLILWLQ